MDYIAIKDITLLTFVAACIGMSFYSSLKMSRDIKEESNKTRDSLLKLLKHSIDTIKSTNLEERVNAVALEEQHGVQLEMLKDAYEAEKELGKEREPRYAHSEDGTRIDLNEYEVM